MAKVYWGMTLDVYDRYVEILMEAARAERDGNHVKHQQLQEEMRLLPGFPHWAHPTEDLIVPTPPDETERKRIIVPMRSH